MNKAILFCYECAQKLATFSVVAVVASFVGHPVFLFLNLTRSTCSIRFTTPFFGYALYLYLYFLFNPFTIKYWLNSLHDIIISSVLFSWINCLSSWKTSFIFICNSNMGLHAFTQKIILLIQYILKKILHLINRHKQQTSIGYNNAILKNNP